MIGTDQQGDAWRQAGYDVRFDCGASGAARHSCAGGAVALVDVLCFTTAVSVAIQRGTSAVYPAPSAGSRAARLAVAAGAALAVERRAVTKDRPWSCSPAALRLAPSAPRLVLPSVNGSVIAAAVRGTAVAASLRNAGAVGSWLARRVIEATSPVTVIAAGARRPNGTLRPALEDLLGAGAVIAALVARKAGLRLSREASAALALYSSMVSVPDAVRACASSVELAERGYAEDVEVAVQVDADDAVPVLVDGAFRPATPARRAVSVPPGGRPLGPRSALAQPGRRLTGKQSVLQLQARHEDGPLWQLDTVTRPAAELRGEPVALPTFMPTDQAGQVRVKDLTGT